jgi:hypothetical protein
MSKHSNRGRTNKGKADRKAHKYILHSVRTLLENRIEQLKKNNALLYPEGGPVVHLTPHEYHAQKIAEAIARISAGVQKRNASCD